MLPPALVFIDVCSERNPRFKLWLPLIILWPLLLAVAVLVVPLAAIAELLLLPTGIKPLSILFGVSRVLGALHGTDIEVLSRKTGKNERVKIYIQ
jgi:hypothetical protein